MSTHAVPHLVVPPPYESAHPPPEHTWPAGHAMPQPPQLAGSFDVVTHAVPHFVVPPLHESAHPPPEHT